MKLMENNRETHCFQDMTKVARFFKVINPEARYQYVFDLALAVRCLSSAV